MSFVKPKDTSIHMAYYSNDSSAQKSRYSIDGRATSAPYEPEEAGEVVPVRLYPSHHKVTMTRYSTSSDTRGYIPVYEYGISNDQHIVKALLIS